MSCGDENWTWFRHYFSLCKKCGSLVETSTQKCEYCENKILDNLSEDNVYYNYNIGDAYETNM